MEVFIEAATGSYDKLIVHEKTLEQKGVRRACRAYPYPYGLIPGTTTDDVEGVDCYVITKTKPPAGTTVDCDPPVCWKCLKTVKPIKEFGRTTQSKYGVKPSSS